MHKWVAMLCLAFMRYIAAQPLGRAAPATCHQAVCYCPLLLLSQAETKEMFHAVIAAEAASAAAVVQEGRNTEDDIMTDDEDETLAFDAGGQGEMERLR